MRISLRIYGAWKSGTLCAVLLVTGIAVALAACQRPKLTSGAAIEFLEKTEPIFYNLSKEFRHVDTISYAFYSDFADELRAANLETEGIFIERFFVAMNENTVMSLSFFVTRSTKDRRKLVCLTLAQRLYGDIDIERREILNAIELTKDELTQVHAIFISGDVKPLVEWRNRADKEQHESFLVGGKRWDALTRLLKKQ